MNLKVGNMPRRRPEFVAGFAGAESHPQRRCVVGGPIRTGVPKKASFLGEAVAAKLKKFSAADTYKRAGMRSFIREAGGSQIQWLSDAGRNQFLNSFV